MKKHILIFTFFLATFNLLSQKDSLTVNEKYWEDQLYITTAYNILNNQPSELDASKVSYGFALGYIRDIPLNKKRTFALGIGLGYNYDFYTHSLIVDENETFSFDNTTTSNRINLHNLEFPIQLRWRTSDAVTYSFWRVYLGLKLSYNLSNKFSYTSNGNDISFKNIDSFNKFQSGLELSVGYGAISFYTYYGLTPIYEDAFINSKTINTTTLKVGLIFYLL